MGEVVELHTKAAASEALAEVAHLTFLFEEGLDFLASYKAIKDCIIRKSVFDLIKSMADQSQIE